MRGVQDGVAMILAEHLDGVIARRTKDAQRVVTNEVWAPLPGARVDVDEQRGIALHTNEIGVALHSGHPAGVGEGGF